MMLTVSAGVLLVPALIALLNAGRHAHMAVVDDSTRRMRLACAAASTGVGGLAVTGLLGAESVVGTAVAVLLSSSVLAWWRLGRSWSVRGVIVWSLLVAGTVGLLGWLAQSLVGSSTSAARFAAGSLAWLVLLLAVFRVRDDVRERIALRAVRDVPPPASEPGARPVPWVVAFLAAGGLALTFALGGAGPVRKGPSTVADRSPDPSTGQPQSGRPSASATPSPGGDPSERPTRESRRATAQEPEDAVSRPLPTGTAPGTTSATPNPPPATKTPGYEKDKPNRPEHVPSPGGGRGKSR